MVDINQTCYLGVLSLSGPVVRNSWSLQSSDSCPDGAIPTTNSKFSANGMFSSKPSQESRPWCRQKSSGIIQKSSKIIQKPCKNHPKTMQKSSKNHPKSSQNHPKIIQKSSSSVHPGITEGLDPLPRTGGRLGFNKSCTSVLGAIFIKHKGCWNHQRWFFNIYIYIIYHIHI